MEDIEKVIDGLKKAKEVIEAWIPMFEQHNSPFTIDCAIELLKEQVPVVPGLEQDADGIYSTCMNCKTRLWKIFGVKFEINPAAMPKFCPHCGQAVKWE